MAAAVSLLLIALATLIVTRVATVALTLTGLSRETARFQARSALSGAGFTTTESEQVVNHPVRRRIVMTLIFTGSIGLVSLVATLSATFVTSRGAFELTASGLILLCGLSALYWLASSRWFDKALTPIMRRALTRYTDLEVRDYAALLQVAGDYAIHELLVEEGDWIADRTLADLRLTEEGVLVLGITHPNGFYDGTPEGSATILAGQVLVLYDVLGISIGRTPRFARNFLADHGDIGGAIAAYVHAVKTRAFPAAGERFD